MAGPGRGEGETTGWSYSDAACAGPLELRESKKKTSIVLAVAGLAICGLAGTRMLLQSGPRKPHYVVLSWHAPRPVRGVTILSYDVHRGPTAAGPFTKIASGVSGLTYTDRNVNSGETYWYVVTSVSSLGRRSVYSQPVRAEIPRD